MDTLQPNERNATIAFVPVDQLKPNPANPRKHGKAQIGALAKSLTAFGFNVPILADRNGIIIAGRARWEAAILRGDTHVPVIFLDHLTKTQATAFMIADNKLAERSVWDDKQLAVHLKNFSELVLDFDIEAIGFELPEIDFRIQSLDAPEAADIADEFDAATDPAVSAPGDLWQLDYHRLYCGSALDGTAYTILMENKKAAAVFSDPPYNVQIDGNVSGHGSIKHREFAMAVGEMNEKEFTDFLTASLTLICAYCVAGALIYNCMDWRHMGEMLVAGRRSGCDLLNLCVWAKNNGGLGSLYRSQHELVFVFRNGRQAHINNIQLGRFWRNRSNVWHFAKVSSFSRKGARRDLELHPTVKPIALVSDAILDSTNRGDIVLDPFLGSGTTLLAAERTGRRCYGIELDPIYIDTAIIRWQRLTGRQALNAQGETFAEVKAKRGISA